MSKLQRNEICSKKKLQNVPGSIQSDCKEPGHVTTVHDYFWAEEPLQILEVNNTVQNESNHVAVPDFSADP